MASDNSNKIKHPGQIGKPAQTPSNGSKPPVQESRADKPKGEKKVKRLRIRWASVTQPDYWVRSYKDITDKYGAPRDHKGVEMVPKAAVPFGGQKADPAVKAAREAAKQAEKAAYAALSDEQKVAHARAKREAKQAEKAAQAAAEKAALVAQIRAEIAAGTL